MLPPPLSGFFAELSTLFHWATQHSHACHLKPDRAIPLERLYSHTYRVCAQWTFSPCNTPWFLLEPPTTHVPLNYIPLLVDVNRGKLYLQPWNSLNVLKRLEEIILTLHFHCTGWNITSIVQILWRTLSVNKGNVHSKYQWCFRKTVLLQTSVFNITKCPLIKKYYFIYVQYYSVTYIRMFFTLLYFCYRNS